jgi:anti-anti-sigma regulatory factor
MLTINIRKIDGVVFFDLVGNLTKAAAVTQVRDAIQARTNAAELQFVLDFRHVKYIDDYGLEALFPRAISDHGGELQLLNLDPSPTGLPLTFNLIYAHD